MPLKAPLAAEDAVVYVVFVEAGCGVGLVCGSLLDIPKPGKLKLARLSPRLHGQAAATLTSSRPLGGGVDSGKNLLRPPCILGGAAGDRTVAAMASAAARLLRAYATQVEALRRLRHGGSQTLRVEHVHVNEGGQALIGNVKSIPGPGR
jgi:hypothetical protein